MRDLLLLVADLVLVVLFLKLRYFPSRSFQKRGSDVVGKRNGIRVHLTDTGAWS